jgi:rhodanese-related sulfurtransferase
MNAPLGKLEEILVRAAERGKIASLAYAGAVSPGEAHQLAQHGARIVDVRTHAEWHYVGRVPGSILIEWNRYPGGERNPRFIDELADRCGTEDLILLLCRSAVRSHAAATLAAQSGFRLVFNILEGFEGGRDSQGRRGSSGGWRNEGLPWEQS